MVYQFQNTVVKFTTMQLYHGTIYHGTIVAWYNCTMVNYTMVYHGTFSYGIPHSSGIYTHTLDAAMGTVPCWQEFMLQVRICKVTDYSS